MQQWLVGGAVIEGSVLRAANLDVAHASDGSPGGGAGVDPAVAVDPCLLLVQNVRRGGFVDWTPPGGVIDEGEALVSGLTREVVEETGLAVTEWAGPLYEITAQAPGLGWHLRVEVHRAVSVEGSVRTGEDPDGIVTQAELVPEVDCERRLGAAHPWVREPLVDWMRDRWTDKRSYRYLVEGSDLADLRISQQEPHE